MLWDLIAGVTIGAIYPGNSSGTPIDSTGATLLIAPVSSLGGAESITDNYGNSWTPGPSYGYSPDGASVQLFYCLSPNVGPGHYLSWGHYYFGTTFLAFDGGAGPALDQYSGNAGYWNYWGIDPGPITPTQSNSLVISGVVIDDIEGGSLVGPGGWDCYDATVYGCPINGVAWELLSSPAATSAAWSYVPGSYNTVQSSLIASFSPGASSAPSGRVGINRSPLINSPHLIQGM